MSIFKCNPFGSEAMRHTYERGRMRDMALVASKRRCLQEAMRGSPPSLLKEWILDELGRMPMSDDDLTDLGNRIGRIPQERKRQR